MKLGDAAAVALAVIALIGLIVGTIAWFYKRGGDERALSDAVTAHAKATSELATQIGVLKDTLVDHDYRIRALEGK